MLTALEKLHAPRESVVVNGRIDPITWLRFSEAAHDLDYTPWFDGTTHPEHIGWYERCFTDGTYRHWWNGSLWFTSNLSLAKPHWRQVGDYPCWRGLLSQHNSTLNHSTEIQPWTTTSSI